MSQPNLAHEVPLEGARAEPSASPIRTRRALTLELFGISDYRWLLASTFMSFMAMNMLMIARGWLILRLTDDSPLALVFVMGSFALPVIFVSLIAGALADRIPRRRLLVLAQIGNAIVTLVVATLDFTGVITFWHLLATGLVNGTLMAVNMPSRQAMISDIVPEDRLMNGIAIVNSGMNLTRMLGPAAAGVLIIYLGTSGVFYLIAGAYALSAVAISRTSASKTPPGRSGRSVTADIKEGLAYAARDPVLLGLVLMSFLPVMFGMSYYALIPAWAREALDVQSDGLGMLMMMMGAGALAGTLMLATLRTFKRRGAFLLACCAAWGVALAIFSQATSFAVAAPLLLFIGLVSSVFMSLNMTMLQLHASPEMRGRVMSIAMMTFGVMPLSALPFGVIAEHIGSAGALLISGVLLTTFTAVFAVGYPQFRRIA